jgi:hypothetical protein
MNVVGVENCRLHDNSSAELGARDFSALEETIRAKLVAAGESAVEQLLQFEPNLSEAAQVITKLQIAMQTDQSGAIGDVRDIIISEPASGWEIGISAKHGHEALKHPRLSQKIDFGKQWFGHPCTPQYFDEVKPLFDELNELRGQALLWREITDKEERFYIPILAAFRKELLRLDSANVDVVAPHMVQYLIGNKDFYKVTKLKNQAKIQIYNFNGTLNQNHKKVAPKIKLDRLKLPNRIIELEIKRDASGGASETTLELVCNGGWQLSFRLHSASSKVEPSLKFDINLIGRPNSLQTFSTVIE